MKGAFLATTCLIWLVGLSSGAFGTTISEAKLLPDGEPVTLSQKVVTYASDHFFYIEEDSRVCGIRVEKLSHGLSVGMRADVLGFTQTDANKERYIAAAVATQNGGGTIPPVCMNNASVGGGDWHYNSVTGAGQKGPTGQFGLNNIGLLIRTCGSFTKVDDTTFIIDDGAGRNIECTLPPGVVCYDWWQYVAVTGISCMYRWSSTIYPPAILVRDVDVLLRHAPCEMIYIPDGSFLMGNNGREPFDCVDHPRECPQHSVYLSGYWIGKYEVTRGEYAQFMAAGGYTNSAYWSTAGWTWKGSRTEPEYWAAVQDWGTGSFTQTDSHPVVGVTYYEAEAFCNWAGGHLPTEAQWEKAARWDDDAPTQPVDLRPRVYPWGDVWDPEKCNSWYDSLYPGYQTAPVGSYPLGASPYGCQDIAGNLWEWCKDWYKSYPGSEPPFDYTGTYRATRGGSWLPGQESGCRCADRGYDLPDRNSNVCGFRLAR